MNGGSTRPYGYLEIICGPMFSGKTSKLLEIFNQYAYCEVPVLVINYKGDTRYSSTHLTTHDRREIPCVFTEHLHNLDADELTRCLVENSAVILVNEGQFFEDLFVWTKTQVEKHAKSVYIAGLDGDFRRETFGDLLKLIPLADKVTKLQSICSQCRNGTPALFSHRKTSEQTQKIIGTDEYIPVCRYCYLRLNDVSN